jgi:hypothetical protein
MPISKYAWWLCFQHPGRLKLGCMQLTVWIIQSEIQRFELGKPLFLEVTTYQRKLVILALPIDTGTDRSRLKLDWRRKTAQTVWTSCSQNRHTQASFERNKKHTHRKKIHKYIYLIEGTNNYCATIVIEKFFNCQIYTSGKVTENIRL